MVVGTFGQPSLQQLKKFIADLTGMKKEEVNLDVAEIVDPKGILVIGAITRARQGNEETAKTDYQEAVERIIADEEFQKFLAEDNFLVAEIRYYEEILAKLTDETERDKINASITDLKAKRLEQLKIYLNTLGEVKDL